MGHAKHGPGAVTLLLLALAFTFLAHPRPAFALALVPTPERGVADVAGILEASDHVAVADAIDGVASSTGARVAVLTLSDAAGEDAIAALLGLVAADLDPPRWRTVVPGSGRASLDRKHRRDAFTSMHATDV
jgi:hypothetical protein